MDRRRPHSQTRAAQSYLLRVVLSRRARERSTSSVSGGILRTTDLVDHAEPFASWSRTHLANVCCSPREVMPLVSKPDRAPALHPLHTLYCLLPPHSRITGLHADDGRMPHAARWVDGSSGIRVKGRARPACTRAGGGSIRSHPHLHRSPISRAGWMGQGRGPMWPRVATSLVPRGATLHSTEVALMPHSPRSFSRPTCLRCPPRPLSAPW